MNDITDVLSRQLWVSFIGRYSRYCLSLCLLFWLLSNSTTNPNGLSSSSPLLPVFIDHYFRRNWFVVFSPMYALDVIIVVMLAIKWFRHSTSGRSPLSSSTLSNRRLNERLYCLTCVLMKLSFEVVLCLRLQYFRHLAFYVVFIPLWICLISSLSYFMTKFLTNRSFFA